MNGPVDRDDDKCGNLTSENVLAVGQTERDSSSNSEITPISHHVVSAVSVKSSRSVSE